MNVVCGAQLGSRPFSCTKGSREESSDPRRDLRKPPSSIHTTAGSDAPQVLPAGKRRYESGAEHGHCPPRGMGTTAGLYNSIKPSVPSTSGCTGPAQRGYPSLKGRSTRNKSKRRSSRGAVCTPSAKKCCGLQHERGEDLFLPLSFLFPSKLKIIITAIKPPWLHPPPPEQIQLAASPSGRGVIYSQNGMH